MRRVLGNIATGVLVSAGLLVLYALLVFAWNRFGGPSGLRFATPAHWAFYNDPWLGSVLAPVALLGLPLVGAGFLVERASRTGRAVEAVRVLALLFCAAAMALVYVVVSGMLSGPMRAPTVEEQSLSRDSLAIIAALVTALPVGLVVAGRQSALVGRLGVAATLVMATLLGFGLSVPLAQLLRLATA